MKVWCLFQLNNGVPDLYNIFEDRRDAEEQCRTLGKNGEWFVDFAYICKSTHEVPEEQS